MTRLSRRMLYIALLACVTLSIHCDEKTSVEPVDSRIVTVPINDIRFFPARTIGDCEFNGHGPVVTVRAKLTSRSDSLLVGIYMRAAETQADWSTAEDSSSYHVYTAPPGWDISRIEVTPNPCQKTYTDTDGLYHVDACGWVTFSSMGDTGGNDICGVTLDDTHVNVSFQTINVVLVRN